MVQHIVLDKRRHKKVQQGTVFHLTGLSLLIVGAVFFALYMSFNFQGVYYGGYNDNFEWIYTSYLWLYLAAAAALAEGGLISGQWLNVFLVFLALSKGRIQTPRPMIPYVFAIVAGAICAIYAFIAAWASTFTTIWGWIRIVIVVVSGAEALLVLVTATYANCIFKRHNARMEALGRKNYTTQGRKLLVRL